MVNALFTKVVAVGAITFALSSAALSAVSEFPVRGNEKILISVPEAVLNVQTNPSLKTLRVNLVDGAQDDYQVTLNEGVIDVRSKEALSKENFGQFSPKKRIIEIQGPALPLEVHLFDGQVSVQKWNKETLLHVQKGRIVLRDSSGTAKIYSQSGEIQVLSHQGRVEVDTYKGNVIVRELTGDMDLENFSGETTVDKGKGFISINQGQGSAKVLASSGTLQFELVKGILNSQNFSGRVEGQTLEGPVNIQLANDGEVNVKSQSGRVTIQSLASSGAALNLTTVDGDILGPNYLKVSRDGSQKSLRGRLKGDNQKGSIVVRTQDGAIVLK